MRTNSPPRPPHRRKAQHAVASPSGGRAVRAIRSLTRHGEPGAGRPAKAHKKTPGKNATTRRRR
jgi:hypothetical protein